jgi:tRNA (guanine-N7-)-methyltransferase
MLDAAHRKVRSFVRRPGRATAAQRRALESLLPRYGIPAAGEALDPHAHFGRDAPLVLDIGFGDGEALLTSAVNHPDIDYLGIEVHEPGIGHLLLLLERSGIGNVRIIARDAVEVFEHLLEPACADGVNIFFPDPWPKKRHHKRRLIQPKFVADVGRVLKGGGLLHIATDWQDYADQIRRVVAEDSRFLERTNQALEHYPLHERPPTKFERRGHRLGHEITDLYFVRT